MKITLKSVNADSFEQNAKKEYSFRSKYDTVYNLEVVQHATSLDEACKSLKDLEDKIKEYNTDPLIQKELEEAQDHIQELEQQLEDKKKIEDALKQVEEQLQKAESKDDPLNVLAENIKQEEKKLKDFEKVVASTNDRIDTLNTSISDYGIISSKIQGELSGHVSIEDMKSAAKDISDGYDTLLKDAVQLITGDESTKFLEAWAQNTFGKVLYDVTSAVKNGASDAISGVNELMRLGKTFGGSWRDPKVAATKIQTGIEQIQSGIDKVTGVANKIFSAVTGRDSVVLGKLNVSDNVGLSALGTLSGSVAAGIGSFNALKAGDISGTLSGMKNTLDSAKTAVSSLRQNSITKQSTELENLKTERAKNLVNKQDKNPITPTSPIEVESESLTSDRETKNDSNKVFSGNRPQGSGSDGGSRTGYDDYSADIVYEINIMLDGGGEADISCCTINGVKYRLSSYNLTQNLLEPMLLSFSMEKENKEETQQDVIFADATRLIGKSIEVNVKTIKSSHDDSSATPQKAFVFKGMIIDVSASRAIASAQSASITAATYDSIMQNAPHCRSFEDKTLQDIVTEVLKPYSDIASIVNPRFTEKIPYLVQYNQSDFAFVRMLAIRFGEWMYNTGEKLVFGEFEQSGGPTAKLEYPGGSLMAYSLSQNMSSFSFNHLLANHYKYGESDDIKKKSGKGEADGNINEWTEKAYEASQKRLSQEHVAALSAGGFDNHKDEEGADSILDYSVKIEAHGKKTGLMSVTGSSKLAMLKIGQQMLICDNVQNISGQNQDVKQKALMVIGISHSFDYKQEYSNTFTAIPVACKYPAYSNANVHAIAPSQRAKVVDNKDEQKLGRIRVQFPWQEIQDKEMKSPWLRIAVPYAGKEKGHQFIPEIDEEVMVGFEMDNAERPYIIGALYNGGEGKPDEKWSAAEGENDIKAIRTRNGHTILFNDKGDAGILEIYDNKNNTYHITLSADDKKITIYSAGDIEINADGSIAINSKENISIEANKNISIEANKKVSVQASKVEVR